MTRRIAYWDSALELQLERDATPEEEAQFLLEEQRLPTEREYIVALEAMFDAKAAERRYASRMTCVARAGYAGPFQEEATTFAVWMDTCNMTAYGIMYKVLHGQMAQPTIAGLLAMMPTMTWPPQVY